MEFEKISARRVLTPEEVNAYKGKFAPELEPNVTKPCVVYDADTGEPVVGYLPLRDVALLRKAVVGIPMTGVQRSTAFRSASRTFGSAPRKPVQRRDACRLSAFAVDEPARHAVLEKFADQLGETIVEIDPRIPEHDREVLGVVLPEWRMGSEKLWTSGVINQSAKLPYHRDAFNFKTWSAMPVIRRGMRGGHLHIPEYDLTIACADGYAVYFCGRELMHGVTPMKAVTKDAYRYSIVYYALRGMKDCYTYAMETAYGKRKRTEREREMAKRVKEGNTSIVASSLSKKKKGT